MGGRRRKKAEWLCRERPLRKTIAGISFRYAEHSNQTDKQKGNKKMAELKTSNEKNIKAEYLEDKKIVRITLLGFLTEEATKQASEAYPALMANFNTRETSLLIDCRELKVFPREAVPYLQKCFELYRDSHFRHVVFINSSSPIPKSQLGRVANDVSGFPGVFVDTEQEAFRICAG